MSLSRRDDFFDFDGWTYLNCAYQGPLPRVSAVAVEHALGLERCPNRIEERLIIELPDAIRPLAAQLMRAQPEEIAIGTGATHGLNLAAAGLPLGPGDEVLLAPGEFPANLFPWQYHAEHRGYTVRIVDLEGPMPTPEDYRRAASSQTRAVSVAFVSYTSGYRMDLQGLSRLCKERGWYLVVDACQAVGSLAFSVTDFEPDILATGGYKWLLAPYGTGLTYVRKGLIDALQIPVVNWLGLQASEDFNALSRQEMTFAAGARRFDAPETAAFLNLYGLKRSLEYLLEIGIDTVERHHTTLLDYLEESLPQDFRITSDRRPGARSGIVFLAGNSQEATKSAYRRLRKAKVHVSLRENRIRVSPHIYNDRSDIDRLLEAVS